MSGGTGAGDHMWNIVTMDDGCNYLVDVTNCDTGSIGAPGKLFPRKISRTQKIPAWYSGSATALAYHTRQGSSGPLFC